MLEEGRSYSGYERNTAFLHLGGETARFADVSGASGLDLMDDGRSIAVCDWDYDGREDFWITNRNAPRLRLQHNRSQTANSFVAVKLKGTTCNRDAIGARVEIIQGIALAKLQGQGKLRTHGINASNNAIGGRPPPDPGRHATGETVPAGCVAARHWH